MNELPDARLLNPLVISGLLSIMGVAATGFFIPPPEDSATAGLVERMIHNPFVLTIGFVGLWAIVYGLLQLWAIGADTSPHGLSGWISGQGGGGQTPPWSSDPNLSAGLFIERWDRLAARRIAPLSYAVWVLPLLGFVGTVVGISEAIGGLGTVFSDGDRQKALESVLGALRFAFDTTFAGLVLVIPVMALSTWISLADQRARDLALTSRFAEKA